MARSRHPDKHIEKAVSYAEDLGWVAELSNGHIWGKLYCPERSRDGCIVFVYSTPRSRETHARQLRREIDLCPHCRADEPTGT
ncbi:MAG: hypothetical protein IT425_15365 [Pirellulales bacterium]|nr:hypothetical protein [Pirellulales bacterium]